MKLENRTTPRIGPHHVCVSCDAVYSKLMNCLYCGNMDGMVLCGGPGVCGACSGAVTPEDQVTRKKP
jgi:hypothetical protein